MASNYEPLEYMTSGYVRCDGKLWMVFDGFIILKSLLFCVWQVRAEEDGDLSIVGATAFAGGLCDALLAIHYLGVLLTEVRQLSPQYQVFERKKLN